MRRSANVLALSVAAVTSLTMLAGSASATSSQPQSRIVTLTIHAVGRDGRPELVVNGAYDGYTVSAQGGLGSGRNQLEPGRYAIGVEVPTLDSQGNDIANTLIARSVNVQHNMTVTLSARHSVPVKVSLNGVRLDDVMGSVCASTFGHLNDLVDAQQGPPPLYIVPYRSRTLRFVYQAESSGAGGAEINLAHSFAGLPAKPAARFTTARLAKVRFRVTSGAVRPWRGNAGSFSFSPGGQACDGTLSSSTPSVLDPSVTTEYFSPGIWLPGFSPDTSGGGSVGETLTDTYAAGHKYSDTFYGAAWGPADFVLPSAYPATGDALTIWYMASNFVNDPAETSGAANDTRARAAISLIARGRTLARRHLRNLDGEPSFQHAVHRSGWYTLAIDATRPLANGSPLLSPRVTVRWRFHVSVPESLGPFPVSVTQFRVGGLNLDNQAAPAAHTTIGVLVMGRSGAPNSPSWREVKEQVSFNDGGTWQTVRLHRHGRVWTLAFRERVSGDVSLRSTVVSANGDSSVQTIYDAYNIQ